MSTLLASFGSWLVGVLSRELIQYVQKLITNYLTAKQAAQAATDEQKAINSPTATDAEKKSAEQNVLDSH